MKSCLSKLISIVLVLQIVAGPIASADVSGTSPPISAKMEEWVRTIQVNPVHQNVLWVLKEMNRFAADPDTAKQIVGKIGNRFRELRKDMLQASGFHQQLDRCAEKEKHADAAVDDLEFRYVLRSIENRRDCIACNVTTPQKKDFVDKLGKPFHESRSTLTNEQAMTLTYRNFGFMGDGAEAEYNDVLKLMTESVLETQKNVLRNYIYFKEHFEAEQEPPKVGLIPKPRDGAGYVHSLFFGCYNTDTGDYQPPLIGCGPQSFYETEGELQRFADEEIKEVHERFGPAKNADQVYADLEPIFLLMEDEERDSREFNQNLAVENRAREKAIYDFEKQNRIVRDGISVGVPKPILFFKNGYPRTRELISANIGHESAFLFQTDALNIDTAAKPENRSVAARKELIRAAIREVIVGTKTYSDYIKRKGGAFNGFLQPKDRTYINQTTNMLIRTSPNAVVETLFDDPKLVHASCESLQQMARSYQKSNLDRVLLWGGILVAGVTIALITGGLAVPGFAAITANLGLFTYTTAAGITLTSVNLVNNISRMNNSNFGEQISVLKAADPAVDRYQNDKLKRDLEDAVAQQKKMSIRILWNLIDLATYAAMPLLIKAWDKFLVKYINKVDPNDMFVIQHVGDSKYISVKDADGKMIYGKIMGSTEDGLLTKIKMLGEKNPVVVTAAERALWKTDAVSRLKFDQQSVTALADANDVAQIGIGIKMKFVRLQNVHAIETAVKIRGGARSIKDRDPNRRKKKRGTGAVSRSPSGSQIRVEMEPESEFYESDF